MKTRKQILTMLLTVIMMLSALTVSVSAANPSTVDLPFAAYPIDLTTSFSDPITARTKYDASPVYVKITDSGYSYQNVLTQACGYRSIDDYGNETRSNGAVVDAVNVYEGGSGYLIRTMIHEHEWPKATLRFRTPLGSNIIDGIWSPDSIGRDYPVAT